MNRTSLTKNVLTASLLMLPFSLVAGDAPGAFKVPGTDTTIKIYGFAELNGTYDTGAHNTDIDDYDWASCLMTLPFDNASAATGQIYSQKKNSLYMTGRTSRIGFTTTTPSDLGPITMVVEGDFNSPSPNNFSSPVTTNGNTFRLRKAYGQIGGFLFGQTWSNFFDGDSLPDTVDFNAVPSACLERIPMVQYTFASGSKSTLSFSAEFPFNRQWLGVSGGVSSERMNGANDTGLNNGNISSQSIPDLHFNWTYSDGWGHVSLRGVALSYQGGGNQLANGTTTPDNSATGFGGALSGHFAIAQDTLVWSVQGGDGIGRMMFGSLFQGGINDGQKIDLWKGVGWHVGYTHVWDAKWRSNLIYSQVSMSDPGASNGQTLNRWIEQTWAGGAAALGPDLLPNKTLQNAMFNTFYQISKTTYCGVEYAWGTRKTFETYGATGGPVNGGNTGTQKRLNFVFHANFF
jgi:Porin subfamily